MRIVMTEAASVTRDGATLSFTRGGVYDVDGAIGEELIGRGVATPEQQEQPDAAAALEPAQARRNGRRSATDGEE